MKFHLLFFIYFSLVDEIVTSFLYFYTLLKKNQLIFLSQEDLHNTIILDVQ